LGRARAKPNKALIEVGFSDLNPTYSIALSNAMFPTHRPRRLRTSPQLRRMVRENALTTSDLIYPLFAVPGEAIAKEVKSMPGVYQLSVDKIVEEAKEVYDLGIPSIILFGIPTDKDADATGAWHDC